MSSAPFSAAPEIPDYELVRAVGRGAYGDVWLARSVTGSYRAIKVIWRSRFVDEEPYEREFSGLCDYARISINERRQLALLHVGRNDTAGFFYYVMELADDIESGTLIDPNRYEPLTLTHYRSQARQLPVRQIVAHAVELARALALLHANGLVHRDIKPSNIILVEGQPKLADIGLVAPTRHAKSLVGTEGFMPPEGPGTPSADVYSMGKVLYELAMGRDRQDYPRLAEDLRTRADRQELMELNEVVIRACEPIPALRYPDAEALLKDLLLLQSGRSVRRLRMAERGLARARRAAIILAVVTGIAFAGAWLERQRAEQEAEGRRAAEEERDQLARITLYSAGLARAQRALETADYGRARELLRELIPADPSVADLRGFEWRALWHEAQGDPAEIIRDSGPAVDRVYFSPDGRRFVVHDASKVATIYDAATRQPERTVAGIYRLAGFSADGNWLLGTTPEFALQAWEVENGEPVGAAQGSGINRPMAALPDGGAKILVFTEASGRERHCLRIWDLVANREVCRWPMAGQPQPAWEFRTTDILSIGGYVRMIVLHDRSGAASVQQIMFSLNDPQELLPWPETHDPSVTNIRAHAQEIVDAEFRRPGDPTYVSPPLRVWQKTDRASAISALAFSPDQRFLAIGTKHGSVAVFDAESGEQLCTLQGHLRAVLSVAWSSDCTSLVTADSAGHVRHWRLPLGKSRTTIEGLTASSSRRQVHFSSDGERIAAPVGSDRVAIFSVTRLDQETVIEDASLPVGFRDGTFMALDRQRRLRGWKMSGSGEAVVHPAWSASALLAVASGHKSPVAATTDQGELMLGESWAAPPRLKLPLKGNSVGYLTAAPNGAIVAGIVDGYTLHVWRVSDGVLQFTLPMPPPAEELTIAPDASLIAVCMTSGDVAIVDVAQQREERRLRVTSTAVTAAFTPDSARLICAGRNGMLHIYQTKDWREIATLADLRSSPEDEVGVAGAVLSPDGATLAVLRRDGKLRLWRAP